LSMLAEPINALTNLAFLIAAYLGYSLLKKKQTKDRELLILPWMLLLVGLGSLAYHTARNSLTLVIDGLPIYIFILYAFFICLRELMESKLKATLVLAGFIMLEILLSIYFPRELLNGSIRHIVAVAFVSIMGWFVTRHYGPKVIRPLVEVVGLYILAIIFRSIDVWICTWFPIGTHFLWHILTAFAGYQVIHLLSVIKSSE